MAQHTNDQAPPYTHGVFAGLRSDDLDGMRVARREVRDVPKKVAG